MNPKSHDIVVFTDGSSRGNPGPGGYAAIIIFSDSNDNRGELKVESKKLKVTELGGREEHTTNNRMELKAAIKALQQIQDVRFKVQVFTDSSYVVNGITKWVYSWERRNWVTMDKKPVLNKDLWEKLLELVKLRKIDWKLVGGHVGVAGNVRCDVIAQTYADPTQTDAEKKLKLYSGPLSGYPIKNVLDIKHNASAAERKSSSRAHSSANAYSYVSLVDGIVQTHKTWAECEKRVKGKQARFKKATSKEDESKVITQFTSKK